MQPFHYHDGQRDVQREANSVAGADKLSTWVGPVAAYAAEADLIVLASLVAGDLRIAALSGPAPLVSVTVHGDDIALSLPRELEAHLTIDAPWGGIVINPATARRSRIAGTPTRTDRAGTDGSITLPCRVAFTNCRKYMTPTSSVGNARHIGAVAETECSATDAWIANALLHAETAFLVTATPEGVADVSHRGGEPGFLRFDASRNTLSWTEYLGDGMFVSTGNVRQRARTALIALDFASGDAVRIDGTAQYTNVRSDRHERIDALLQSTQPFPMQGRMELIIDGAARLTRFTLPRARVARRARISSADSTAVQHPQ